MKSYAQLAIVLWHLLPRPGGCTEKAHLDAYIRFCLEASWCSFNDGLKIVIQFTDKSVIEIDNYTQALGPATAEIKEEGCYELLGNNTGKDS